MLRNALTVLAAVALLACNGSPTPSGDGPDATDVQVAANDYDTEIPMVEYKWNPDAGDKSVSAEMGGPGFTGEGWETRLTFHSAGDPNAPKGGELTTYMNDWPATVRMTGKDWNTQFNYFVNGSAFMGLLSLDPVTLEFVPNVATHWKISEDKQSYQFRINPEAKWSDGSDMTAEDVVATWKLRTDPKILDPSANVYYGRAEPKVISKYIVEYTVKEESWNNFLGVATAGFWPAKEISMPGDQYLDEFQFKYTSVSGPYEVLDENIKTGSSITLTRRDDFWGKDNPAFAGWGNIDRIKWVVVKDMSLAFEKAKKGELDFYVVPKAQWWAEVIPELDQVKRGLIIPTKIFNDEPIGTSGIAINVKRQPLDDKRIRKALQLLHPTERLIETLYYNEYDVLTSYWQGGMYMNPGNKKFEFDPVGAVELLVEAGWTELNDEGYRMKDGKELALSLQYASQLSERALTIYQEELKDAGIRLNLELLTPAARWKNLRQKEFDLSNSAWGAIVFPNPESSWHSKYADQVDTNNVTSFSNAKVDELIEAYQMEYDITKRAAIIQQMDAIIYNEHPYVLEHYLGCQRVMVANKFGKPKWGAPRFADEYDMLMTWWVDPEAEAKLAEAKADPKITLEVGDTNIRFWEAWHSQHATAEGE
jgi:microcin C transport system substrate-binding protein